MSIAIAAGAPGYPSRLHDLADPPLILYASAPLPHAERWVAIVGSRRASEEGRVLASRMAKRLAEQGAGVVSGGAIGIDAAAHRGALEGGGPTIVVLPSPVDRPVPKQNRALFAEVIARGGALVSELAEPPQGKKSFMTRNRIIAALADAVIVVEAGPRSGTRHTLRSARALGRLRAVVPWVLDDPRGAGGRSPAAAGASVVGSLAALAAWLSLPPRGSVGDPDPILAALPEEAAITIDRLAARAKAPIARVLAHLTRLEVEGRVAILPGGRVRRP